MIRIEVDFNHSEGQNIICVPTKAQRNLGKNLREGTRLIIHEKDIECEAILERGKVWSWVAKVIEGTIKQLPYED